MFLPVSSFIPTSLFITFGDFLPTSPFVAPSSFIILARICQPPPLFRPRLLFETQEYMDTDSFVIHIKTEDFYKDIADDAEMIWHIKLQQRW